MNQLAAAIAQSLQLSLHNLNPRPYVDRYTDFIVVVDSYSYERHRIDIVTGDTLVMHGKRYEIADPGTLDKLAADLAAKIGYDRRQRIH